MQKIEDKISLLLPEDKNREVSQIASTNLHWESRDALSI